MDGKRTGREGRVGEVDGRGSRGRKRKQWVKGDGGGVGRWRGRTPKRWV